MTIDQMRLFSMLCRIGNFTRAASQIFITQEGLSYHIRQMEKELGYPLFVRNNKQVELTPEGEKWFTAVDAILGIYDSTVQSVAELRDQSRPVLNLSYIGYDYSSVFSMIGDFLAARPQVDLHLITESMGNLGYMLLEMKTDILYGSMDLFPNNSMIDFVPTGKYCNGFVIRRDDPLADRKSLRWSDLAGRTFILHSMFSSDYFRPLRIDVERIIAENCPGNRIIYAADFMTCVTMVDLGMGVFLTAFDTRTGLRHIGRNCIMIPCKGAEENDVGFLYLRNNTKQCVRDFLDFARGYTASDCEMYSVPAAPDLE